MRLPSGKRLKWEPAAAMVLVLALGLWIAVGPVLQPRLRVTPGATSIELRDGESRGKVEYVAMPPAGEPRFRILREGQDPVGLTDEQARLFLSTPSYRQLTVGGQNWVFKLLNITSWYSLIWIGIGLGGQLVFSGRMVLQWLISERRRESVVTESFWWISLVGAVTMFAYFVWRRDPVPMLGQASGIVIYARNLRLIYKHKRRARRAAEATR
jgi:lipid-A-disaccharide synthase-like uncharacterized protein